MGRVARAAAVAAAMLGLASGSRIDHNRRHEAAAARVANQTAAELEEARTKELLERAAAKAASADSILKEVQDAGIYQAAENLRKAKVAADAKAAAKMQQIVQGSMDLALMRAPAPATKENAKSKHPVSSQVSQKDMDAFVATLSSACGKQFTAIMGGTAPAIHTFGEAGVNSTAGGCSRLEGAICATEAQIESEKKGPADRHMRSVQQVTGQGCLPRSCTAQGDLQALAGFMQSKAKEAVPGTGVLVKLSVDCTESGGATAKVGYEEDAAPRGARVGKNSAARGGALAALALALGASFW